MDVGLNTMAWPAKSPYLHLMENAWSWLSKELYRNNRQFDNVDDLEEALHYTWDKIPRKLVKKLVRSMPRRCGEVLVQKGGPTRY